MLFVYISAASNCCLTHSVCMFVYLYICTSLTVDIKFHRSDKYIYENTCSCFYRMLITSALIFALLQKVKKSYVKTAIFTARRYASAALAVIVCLSVRPSQVGVVQRWLNLGSD